MFKITQVGMMGICSKCEFFDPVYSLEHVRTTEDIDEGLSRVEPVHEIICSHYKQCKFAVDTYKEWKENLQHDHYIDDNNEETDPMP